jgi:NADH-quinone oxidoreductase subunit J
MSLETLFVAVVAAVAAVAGVMVVLMRTTVYSALFLVLNFFCLAVLYITLSAEFVGIVNVIVYAGAIMVLFLFVIFLINPTSEVEHERLPNQRALGVGLGGALLVLVALIVWRAGGANLGAVPPSPAVASNITAVAEVLYSRYVLPFEATSLILLAAIIGAIVLAKRTL